MESGWRSPTNRRPFHHAHRADACARWPSQHWPSPPVTPPAPVRTIIWAIIRAAVIDDGRAVIDRTSDNFIRPFNHVRSLPIGTRRNRRRALLRDASAHVERGLDRKTSFVLPGDLAPAAVASAGIDQAAAGNLGDDFAA